MEGGREGGREWREGGREETQFTLKKQWQVYANFSFKPENLCTIMDNFGASVVVNLNSYGHRVSNLIG